MVVVYCWYVVLGVGGCSGLYRCCVGFLVRVWCC